MTKSNTETTTIVPKVITQTVVALAKVCAFYNFPLDLNDTADLIILEQADLIEKQRKIIADLEKRLGIDDEL